MEIPENKTWDHTVFAQLFIHSPKKAFEYRFMATGTPIPDEWADKTGITDVTEEFTDTTDEDPVQKLRDLLTENGIKFSHLAGEKKLRDLATANNLL